MLLYPGSIFELTGKRIEGYYGIINIVCSTASKSRRHVYEIAQVYDYELARCAGTLNVEAIPRMDAAEDFNGNDANAISMFYHSMRLLDVDKLYIQCDAGITVSPAIVAALHRYTGDIELHDQLWLDINTWPSVPIYTKMCQVLHMSASTEYVKDLSRRACAEYDIAHRQENLDEPLYH